MKTSSAHIGHMKTNEMELGKTVGSVLFELFGPNGCDGLVSRTEARRMAAFRELERHGMVEITERAGQMVGLFDVRRTCRGLKGGTK